MPPSGRPARQAGSPWYDTVKGADKHPMYNMRSRRLAPWQAERQPGQPGTRGPEAPGLLLTSHARWIAFLACLSLVAAPADGSGQRGTDGEGTAAASRAATSPATGAGTVTGAATVTGAGTVTGAAAVSGAQAAGSAPTGPVASPSDLRRMEALARAVTIHRDTWGVPHVVGTTDESAMFGAAYARAEDQLLEDEPFFLDALGRRAELDGEDALDDDRLVRAYRIPDLARSRVRDRAAEDPRHGRGLRRRRELLPVIAIPTSGGRCSTASSRGTSSPSTASTPDRGWPARTSRSPSAPRPDPTNGSNAWAVGPSRTASGHAMLFSNTHMRFNVPYEFHVKSDDGLNVSGITGYAMVGLPFVGRNERIGWTVTVNYPDVVDVYRLTFDHPDDPLAYRYDDGYRRADEWVETIRVRTDERRRGASGRRFAGATTARCSRSRRASTTPSGARTRSGGSLFPLYYAIAKARNLDEFKAAFETRAARLPQLRIRRRRREHLLSLRRGAPAQGPALRLGAARSTAPIPATAWQGTLSVAETPQDREPGQRLAAERQRHPVPRLRARRQSRPCPRSRPTWSAKPGPRTLRPLIDDDGDGARARQSRRLLAAESGITFDRWTALATDNHFLTADEELPGLFDEWDAPGGRPIAARAARARRAAAPAPGMGPARRGAFRGNDALRPLARGDARRRSRNASANEERPANADPAANDDPAATEAAATAADDAVDPSRDERLAARRRPRGRHRRPDGAPRHVANELGRHQPPPAPALYREGRSYDDRRPEPAASGRRRGPRGVDPDRVVGTAAGRAAPLRHLRQHLRRGDGARRSDPRPHRRALRAERRPVVAALLRPGAVVRGRRGSSRRGSRWRRSRPTWRAATTPANGRTQRRSAASEPLRSVLGFAYRASGVNRRQRSSKRARRAGRGREVARIAVARAGPRDYRSRQCIVRSIALP